MKPPLLDTENIPFLAAHTRNTRLGEIRVYPPGKLREPNSLPRELGIVFYRRQNGKSILCGRIWDVIAAHSLRILK